MYFLTEYLIISLHELLFPDRLVGNSGLRDHWQVAMCQQLALTVWDQEEDLAVATFQATCYHMRTTPPYQRIQFQ
jgi:hypothetical protein